MISLALTTIFGWMCAWFIVSRLIKRNDIADIAWGFGFVVLAWTLYYNQPSAVLALAVLPVTIWGIRLGVHIFLRNRKKTEDYRYQQWRKEWGRWFVLRSFLQVFMLQGLLLLLIATPLLFAAEKGGDAVGAVNFIGLVIWAFGFVFEALGDYELSKFLKNPKNKGKLLQGGLWRYSRHPNYFGEVTQWWGIWLTTYGTPWFWYALIGPLTITLLILKVSGIPMLEKKYQGNKVYEQYKKRTSMFFPLPPKKG